MKLSHKMTLSFIFIIVLSLTIVGTMYKIAIDREFDTYLIDEQETLHQKISTEINSIYEANDFIIYPRDLNYYSNLGDIDISIADLEGNILYSSFAIRDSQRPGHGRQSSQTSYLSLDENYDQKNYPLNKKGEQIGSIVIGFINESYITENAKIFMETLNPSLIVAGIIASILGIIIGIFLSRSLSKPISGIKDMAVGMSQGQLIPKEKINTDTKEIEELSKAIEVLGRNLAKQEDIRKKYASDISHELRTPITTIKSHIEAIIDGVWEPNEKHLNILISEVDRLSNLVQDLDKSFASEIYDVPLNKKEFNLSEKLEKIYMTYKPIFQNEGHTIKSKLEPDIFIDMDEERFEQIMHNLISNSKKHLIQNGTVLLSLSKSSNSAFITVKDDGSGIKDEDIPFLFDRFYRADESRTKDTGGSGIGLSIVKSFVEEQGGKISIESEYGVGTKVKIQLSLISP